MNFILVIWVYLHIGKRYIYNSHYGQMCLCFHGAHVSYIMQEIKNVFQNIVKLKVTNGYCYILLAYCLKLISYIVL